VCRNSNKKESRVHGIARRSSVKISQEFGARNLVRLPPHSVNCHGPVVGNVHPILLKEVLEIGVFAPPLLEESLEKRLMVFRA
jgi:hypothetical protein